MITTCQPIDIIPPKQCLFESRVVINSNTSKIDTMLCAASGMITNYAGTGVALIKAGNGISFTPVGTSGSGNVTLTETVCPPWNIGLTGKQLYTETGANKISVQHVNNQVVRKHISDTIERNNVMKGSETITYGNSIFNTLPVKYAHSVVLPDRRVFLVPSASTTSAIYDPVTDSITTPSAGSYPGNTNSYTNGILLPNGKIFMVPFNTTFARTYDYMTDTLSIETLAGTYSIIGGFSKGVLLPSGKIFHVPYNSSIDRTYDPTTNTTTSSPAVYTGTQNFSDGVLLYDGRVFLVPYKSTVAVIHDPVTNTNVNVTSETFINGGMFSGGVLLPDGRVFCVPSKRTRARIFTPNSNHLSIPKGIYSAAEESEGGCLLTDGRVLMHPKGVGISIKIYDPNSETVFDTGINPNKNGQCNKGVLLRDGDVLYTPRSGTTVSRFRYYHQACFSSTFITGIYNK